MEATAVASAAGHVLATNLTNTRAIRPTTLPLSPPLTITTTNPKSSLLSARILTHCCPERDLTNNSKRSRSIQDEAAEEEKGIATNDINQLPLTSTATNSQSHGLVFAAGPDQSWDAHAVGSPVVKRFVGDHKERWFMWYHGGASSSSIGLAVSNNGAHWERGAGPVPASDGVGQVMQRSSDWWAFDTHAVRPADVLIMSSSKLRASAAVYWLYYTGFTPERLDIDANGGFKTLPGLAISQDGRHWARIEGEHHSGALFDVGGAGQWDSAFVAAPKVVYHGRGDLRMFYHSWDLFSGRYAIGMARSRDGIRWVKLGKVLDGGPAGTFDEGGVLNGHVVRIGNGKDVRKAGMYLMAYQGVNADGQISVGLAVSEDGLREWRRCGDESVLKASVEDEDRWDCRGVGDPCLVQMDGEGEWRMYYRGADRSGRTAIGFAVSQDGSGVIPTSFERWTGFHL